MTLTGSDLVAQALRRQGVDAFFYIMGAPMSATSRRRRWRRTPMRGC